MFEWYVVRCDFPKPDTTIINQRFKRDWTTCLKYDDHLMLRATSHPRPRARDLYTSSTLVGGKGGAGPSSPLHTTLEGRTEHVNARWMYSLHGSLDGIEWIVIHGHLDCFQKPTRGGRPNTKPGDHGTLNTHNHWFIMCEGPCE